MDPKDEILIQIVHFIDLFFPSFLQAQHTLEWFDYISQVTHAR